MAAAEDIDRKLCNVLEATQQLVVKTANQDGSVGIEKPGAAHDCCLIGSVEQSVPELGTSDLCLELSYMFAGDDCFAMGSPVDTRWRVLCQRVGWR